MTILLHKVVYKLLHNISKEILTFKFANILEKQNVCYYSSEYSSFYNAIFRKQNSYLTCKKLKINVQGVNVIHVFVLKTHRLRHPYYIFLGPTMIVLNLN